MLQFWIVGRPVQYIPQQAAADAGPGSCSSRRAAIFSIPSNDWSVVDNFFFSSLILQRNAAFSCHSPEEHRDDVSTLMLFRARRPSRLRRGDPSGAKKRALRVTPYKTWCSVRAMISSCSASLRSQK